MVTSIENVGHTHMAGIPAWIKIQFEIVYITYCIQGNIITNRNFTKIMETHCSFILYLIQFDNYIIEIYIRHQNYTSNISVAQYKLPLRLLCIFMHGCYLSCINTHLNSCKICNYFHHQHHHKIIRKYNYFYKIFYLKTHTFF